MTSTDDPALETIGAQPFRLVRKGFDPEEVRSYLVRLDGAVARLRTIDECSPRGDRADRATAGVSEGGRAAGPVDEVAGAEGELMHLQTELGQLQAEQDALRAWFGEAGRADPAEVPQEVSDAAARANELIRDAEAEAAEIVTAAEARADRAEPALAATSDRDGTVEAEDPGPEPEPEGPSTAPAVGGDRWDNLGEHVARILAHAEEEANVMKAEVAAATARDAEAAEADRTAARDHLAQTQLLVMSMLNDAEASAAAIRERAEPQARDHVAEIMAQARAELDATHGALRDARARLTEVHTLVGQSLAEAGDELGFADPADLVVPGAGLRSTEGLTLAAVPLPVDGEPGDAGAPAADEDETERGADTASDDTPSVEASADAAAPADDESTLAQFFDEQDPPGLVHSTQFRRSDHGGWRARFTRR